MTILDTVNKLLALSEEATPGPWNAGHSYVWCRKKIDPNAFLQLNVDEKGFTDFTVAQTSDDPFGIDYRDRGLDASYIAACSPETIKQICLALIEMKDALEDIASRGNCDSCNRHEDACEMLKKLGM